MSQFSPEQLKIVREQQSAPLYAKAGPRVRKGLLEADITESNISRDPQLTSEGSAGTLQQTPAQGWGTLQQVDNERYAAEQFLKRAIPLSRSFKGSAGELAQAVQKSAYPERYDQHSSEADQLLQMLGNAQPTNSNGAALMSALGGSGSQTEGAPNTAALQSLISSLQQPSGPQQTRVPLPAASAAPPLPEGFKLPAPEQTPSPASKEGTGSAILAALQAASQGGGAVPSSGLGGGAVGGSAPALPQGGAVPNAKGGVGFTPAPGTNYEHGHESTIASRANALAKALGLKLTGVSGYRTPEHSVAVGGFADDPHTRGEASDTPGVENVPEAVLNKYGLERPFDKIVNGKHTDPKEADHIQLLGSYKGK